MGKTLTPRYVVRRASIANGAELGPFLAAWDTKQDGRPTSANLDRWRDAFNLSLMPGGSNDHIGRDGWLACGLVIFDQQQGRAIVYAPGPTFERIPTPAEAAQRRADLGLYSRPDPAPDAWTAAIRELEAARDQFYQLRARLKEAREEAARIQAQVIAASQRVKAAQTAAEAAQPRKV